LVAVDNRPVAETIESLIQTYADRYSAHDAEGVAELCEAPFLAIREGVAIHMADHDAVREHFAGMMNAYRGQGATLWIPITIEAHQTGDFAVFATVRWNATDEDGEILRDTRTTYHLLGGDGGWRFLSYTNHF
jgi:ketosteroid isomerase-like protein